MRRMVLSLALLIMAVSAAQSENVLCPPPKSITLGDTEWRTRFDGLLTEVWVSNSIGSGVHVALIICKRLVGSTERVIKKSCNLIPKVGRFESLTRDENSETSECHMSKRDDRTTNDKQCLLICD
jgi:hypothetical protein